MKKFSKVYPIKFYHVGRDQSLTLYALMNMIQDIASDHAQLLGFGREQLDEDTHWVLVRQTIEMDYWPRWQEEITLETFISHPQVGTPPRDIRVYHQNKVIGRGQTSWLVVDGKTRKIATQKVDLLLQASIEESSGAFTHKIQIPHEGVQKHKSFQVEYSDLDVNDHVNNAIYGQWVVNSLDLTWLKESSIKSFSINYLQEVLYQDQVIINRKVLENEKGRSIFLEGRVEGKIKPVFVSLVELAK